MKSNNSTISSSVKSSTSPADMEERDSCYYPGCRKDANCNCDICLASFNATLDLRPFSIQKSSLTKLSANVESTPVSFNPSILSTPKSNSYPKNVVSPLLKSTARMNLKPKRETRKREWRSSLWFLKWVLCLSLFFGVDLGFSWTVSGVLRPVFSNDIVRGIGERSAVLKDLSGRLKFLQNELKGFVFDGKVVDCNSRDQTWEIDQDGQILNSRCVLYTSVTEEISIWGWPLQTAGLLKAGFSSRYYTVLSGRVTEWSEGKIGYSIRKTNTSWIQRKWASSVVQLDPNTWILEYGRSSILDYSRLCSLVVELFKCRMSKVVKWISQVSWQSVFEGQYNYFLTAEDHIKIPT